MQRRYGVRKTDISAIGCTRQSEANRRGRWILLTNAYDRTITFSTGLEGAIPTPGQIIGVADVNLAGRIIGGRISSVDERKITLDRKADIKSGDRLIINLTDGKSEARTVQAVNDNIITVTARYSQPIEKNAVWTVDANDLAIQLFSAYTQISQGIAVTTLRADWDATENAISYEAQWRRGNNNWVSIPRTSTSSFEVQGIYAGRYQVRVRAINSSDISSIWANAPETTLKGKEGEPPTPLTSGLPRWCLGLSLTGDLTKIRKTR